MAEYTINTTAPAYQNRHAAFRQFVQDMRPRLRAYMLAPIEIQEKLREHDPLLNDVLRFAEKITELQKDIDVD